MYRLAFCGYGRCGLEILCQILSRGDIPHDNIIVFTNNGALNNEFVVFLRSLRIKFYTTSINDELPRLAEFRPTHIISAYYRNVISSDVLKLVDGKAINLHPSYLPDYKGCFSGTWAIINGESHSGITFHYMTENVDEGNIIYQEHIKIANDETAYCLYHRKISKFVSIFNEVFEDFLQNCPGYPQDGEVGRYYNRRVPYNGTVNYDDNDYEFLKRFVRAMYFPPFQAAEILINGVSHLVESTAELDKIRTNYANE